MLVSPSGFSRATRPPKGTRRSRRGRAEEAEEDSSTCTPGVRDASSGDRYVLFVPSLRHARPSSPLRPHDTPPPRFILPPRSPPTLPPAYPPGSPHSHGHTLGITQYRAIRKWIYLVRLHGSHSARPMERERRFIISLLAISFLLSRASPWFF